MRPPETIETHIRYKIDTLNLLNPNKCKEKGLSIINVDCNQNDLNTLEKFDFKNLNEFVSKIENSLDKQVTTVEHSYQNTNNETINLKCLYNSKLSSITMKFPNNKESNIDESIDLICKKIARNSEKAFEQLVEYNNTNANMYVLLNWMKPRDNSFNDASILKTEQYIAQYNNDLKSINPKLNIELITNFND